MQTSESMRVLIGWDDDRDGPWVAPADGDDETGAGTYSAEISMELWQRMEIASKAYHEAIDAIVEAAGYDDEQCRMKQCCPQWVGSIAGFRETWPIVIPASGDEHTWPLHDHVLGWEWNNADALQRIAAMPESFAVVGAGSWTRMIQRSELRVDHREGHSIEYECRRCGWKRDEHANRGTPDATD